MVGNHLCHTVFDQLGIQPHDKLIASEGVQLHALAMETRASPGRGDCSQRKLIFSAVAAFSCRSSQPGVTIAVR